MKENSCDAGDYKIYDDHVTPTSDQAPYDEYLLRQGPHGDLIMPSVTWVTSQYIVMNKEQKKKRNISTLLFAMQLICENTYVDITRSKCWVEVDNITTITVTSQHNERDGVPNHRRLDCLRNRLFRRRSKKASKPRVIGLSEGNSTVTGEVPHKGPITWKMFPFDDAIVTILCHVSSDINYPAVLAPVWVILWKRHWKQQKRLGGRCMRLLYW